MSSANDVSIDVWSRGVLYFSKCKHKAAMCLFFSPTSVSSSTFLPKHIFHLLWLWGKWEVSWGARGAAATEVSGLGQDRPRLGKMRDGKGFKAGRLRDVNFGVGRESGGTACYGVWVPC